MVLGSDWNDHKDKPNAGYTLFKPTGVRHEFPLVDLVKQQVAGTVLYKDKIHMSVVVEVKAGTVQVQGDIAESLTLICSKTRQKFFIDNHISNPQEYYDELINNLSE
ncbi:hypothetical protein [Cytobacillus firmus]|uniref:hypothetical protein n=1 Tax=Cytobacillus firmus TaxID=1399 RepID=UPI0022283676|nr:hypothetical protein [Cytobacillus firmus]